MNREILFRGKRIDNGEWVEGLPYKAKYGCISSIVNGDEERFLISPETIGQFTGLTDKNGKKIFEGDIIKYPYHLNNELVAFFNGAFGYTFANEGVTTCCNFCSFDDSEYGIATDLSEVIGNIHDNPELLKGEGNKNDF